MSTRATYEFKSELFGSITFYIHHDGYPYGAAQYIIKAKELQGPSLADRFYRANHKAEFTNGHSSHGDTDYRYTFEGNKILVQSHEGTKIYFNGTIEDFLDQELNKS